VPAGEPVSIGPLRFCLFRFRRFFLQEVFMNSGSPISIDGGNSLGGFHWRDLVACCLPIGLLAASIVSLL
jgi:hypothetical protein